MITKYESTEGAATVVEKTSRCRGSEVLEYFLCFEDVGGRAAYSILALQYKHGEIVCRAKAFDVSSVYGAAKEMFDRISAGFVEPYVLCDVVYDLLP